MKFRIMTLAAAFVLLPFASAFSADATGSGGTFYGEIGGTAEVVDVNGSKAKFSEYRDMVNQGGFYDNIRLGYDSDDFFLKFRSSDMGYNTQSYNLDTGMYGKFKFNAFENSIVHNTTFGALTPYSGVGGNSLTTTLNASHLPANTNPSTWNSFNYSIQRNQYGGGLKVDLLNPFYVDFSAAREDRSGLLPYSNGNGIEIPAPVQYETTNYIGEIGYRAKPLFAALTFSYGDFTNSNQTMLIAGSGPISNSTASLMSLPPDNHFYKLGFKGVLQLPLNTRFNVSLANSRESSSFNLSPILNFNNSVPGNAQTTLSSTTFNGRKDVENYAFSLTSNPVRFLDVKLFYKYYSTTNKSDTIYQTIAGNTPPTIVVPLFDYKKNNYGADFGFKLPAQFRLNAGYSYIDTDRIRPDIPSTKDNVYSAELKWNGLDFLTPKMGYEHLAREAIIGSPYAIDSTTSHINYPQFTIFDAATQRRDTYKVAADSSPLDNLNVGIAYKYKKSTYPDVLLGVQNATTNELETYGDYLIGGIVRLNAYFDLQYIKQNLHDCDTTSASGVCNTSSDFYTSSSNNGYLWNLSQKDNTYEFGAGVDVYLVPKKLTLRVQYDYVNSDGTEDFGFFSAVPNQVGGVNSNVASGPVGNPNLGDVDAYHKSSLMCKLSYALSNSFTMAVGASFEQFKYNDYALSNPNYQYFNAASNTYLTGAYANPSYNASIVFLSAAYKF